MTKDQSVCKFHPEVEPNQHLITLTFSGLHSSLNIRIVLIVCFKFAAPFLRAAEADIVTIRFQDGVKANRLFLFAKKLKSNEEKIVMQTIIII